MRSDQRVAGSAPVILLAFVLGAAAALSVGARFQDSQDVLRVKGLIVEDPEGRPRIVLGAPLAELEGRVRSDPSVGLVVLDENGRDRVSVGSPAIAPQSGGDVVPRVGGTSGIVFSDETGNARGGFGYLAGGRVVLGIDYPGAADAFGGWKEHGLGGPSCRLPGPRNPGDQPLGLEWGGCVGAA